MKRPNISGNINLSSSIYVLFFLVMAVGSVHPADAADIAPLPVPDHLAITRYDGPQTCVACHRQQAEGMHGSVHYQWSGPTPNVPNIPGNAGKADLGFNTYCGTVVTSRRSACWSCHAGNGRVPRPQASFEQFSNIDCLMCHQENYARKAMPPRPLADFNGDYGVDLLDAGLFSHNWLRSDCTVADGCGGGTDLDNDLMVTLNDWRVLSGQWLHKGVFETVVMTDFLGVVRSWVLPREDQEQNFQYVPNEAAMGVSIIQAAQTVHRPTRATCLRCHAYAAGSDCGKRGDLGTDTINPPVQVDIHMSALGGDFTCQQCHNFQNHRVLGRGLDLRANDRPESMTCLSGNCHGAAPHDSRRLNQHAGHVACQSCHIPRYAKQRTTEMAREWDRPVWAQGLFGGQGGYKPEEIRAMNVIPTYKWYDGTSVVYALGQELTQRNGAGQYEMGVPNGSVNSPGAKLSPMKEHDSSSARMVATGQLIPHSTSNYFMTGDFHRAIEAGAAQAGMPGDWEIVGVHTYQTINHGVEPHDNALVCGQCHASLEGGPVRMNLQGELGYELKGTRQTVCTQCHTYENSEGFESVHDKHVNDKKKDCSWCHAFSRPERGLSMP